VLSHMIRLFVFTVAGDFSFTRTLLSGNVNIYASHVVLPIAIHSATHSATHCNILKHI